MRQERDGASQKVARLAFGGILTRAPRADVRKVLLLPQRVQEPLGRLRLQAQPVQHAGLPLFCRWGASHPDSGCRAERGLTRGMQRECDPDLCLHVSVHVARRPRFRYSKMSSSAVRSVPAPGRGCGTRSNGRPVASSRLRLGVLHSEKNAVAATSGSKLVSTRSDSTRVGFNQNGDGSRRLLLLAAFVAWPVGSSWVGRLRQGTYQEASVHPRVRRRGER